MIKKFELITGSEAQIKEYIENIEDFYGWQIGKSFEVQIERLLKRECLMNHIGAVTYMTKAEDGVVICANFIAITKENIFSK